MAKPHIKKFVQYMTLKPESIYRFAYALGYHLSSIYFDCGFKAEVLSHDLYNEFLLGFNKGYGRGVLEYNQRKDSYMQ